MLPKTGLSSVGTVGSLGVNMFNVFSFSLHKLGSVLFLTNMEI
jgi:hypothetical protein